MEHFAYDETLKYLKFKIGDIHCWDLWLYPEFDDPATRRGIFPPKELQQWLKATDPSEQSLENPPEPCVGQIRFLYTISEAPQPLVILMPKPTFEEMMNALSLPKRYAEIIHGLSSTLAESRPYCKPLPDRHMLYDNPIFSYVFATTSDHAPIWALAVSWDLRINVISIYLQCSADKDVEKHVDRVCQYLSDAVTRKETFHGLLPALAIIDLQNKFALHEVTQMTMTVASLETAINKLKTFTHGYLPGANAEWRARIIKQTNDAGFLVTKIEREQQTELLHLEELERICLTTFDPQGQFERHSKSTKEVLLHTRFLICTKRNLQVRLSGLQKTCAALLTIVYHVNSNYMQAAIEENVVAQPSPIPRRSPPLKGSLPTIPEKVPLTQRKEKHTFDSYLTTESDPMDD